MACHRIVLVLDCSGSMSSQKSDIIGGVNEMIKQQKDLDPPTNSTTHFNIVCFNSIVEEVRNETLESVPLLTNDDYVPGGLTALYDAMGSTIEKYKEEHDVIMLITTDGQENSSRKYTFKQITELVATCKEDKGWNFIYLSEDIDTFEQGNRIGLNHESRGCNNVAVGYLGLSKALTSGDNNVAIGYMRKGSKTTKYKTCYKTFNNEKKCNSDSSF